MAGGRYVETRRLGPKPIENSGSYEAKADMKTPVRLRPGGSIPRGQLQTHNEEM